MLPLLHASQSRPSHLARPTRCEVQHISAWITLVTSQPNELRQSLSTLVEPPQMSGSCCLRDFPVKLLRILLSVELLSILRCLTLNPLVLVADLSFASQTLRSQLDLTPW